MSPIPWAMPVLLWILSSCHCHVIGFTLQISVIGFTQALTFPVSVCLISLLEWIIFHKEGQCWVKSRKWQLQSPLQSNLELHILWQGHDIVTVNKAAELAWFRRSLTSFMQQQLESYCLHPTKGAHKLATCIYPSLSDSWSGGHVHLCWCNILVDMQWSPTVVSPLTLTCKSVGGQVLLQWSLTNLTCRCL